VKFKITNEYFLNAILDNYYEHLLLNPLQIAIRKAGLSFIDVLMGLI